MLAMFVMSVALDYVSCFSPFNTPRQIPNTGGNVFNQRKIGLALSSRSNRQTSILPPLHSKSTKEKDFIPSSRTTTTTTNNNNTNTITPTTKGAWVPVGSASSLQSLSPVPITIMNQNYVVWYSPPTAQWSLMGLDVWSSRHAPLSHGYIHTKTGRLTCPRGLWSVDSDGVLTLHHQLIDNTTNNNNNTNTKVNLPTFPIHLTGDLIWAYLPSSLHSEYTPLLPEEHYHGALTEDMDRHATYYVHEMPSSFHLLIENGLDPSHFAFAHHGVIARREDAKYLPMTVKRMDADFGVEVTAKYMRKGVERERVYSFQRPFLLSLKQKVGVDDDDGDEWKHRSKFFMVPITQGRTRVITSLDILTKRWMPDWIIHLVVSRLFAGDMILHEAEHELVRHRRLKGSNKVDEGYVYATSSDVGVKAWNQWHSKYGMADSPPHTFGAAFTSSMSKMESDYDRSMKNKLPFLTKREQTNQWLIHTRTCSKCQLVLKRLKWIQYCSIPISLILASLLTSIGAGNGAGSLGILGRKKVRIALSLLVSVLGLTVGKLSKKLIGLHEGFLYESEARERNYSMEI